MREREPFDLPKANIDLPPFSDEKATEVSQEPSLIPALRRATPVASDHPYKRLPRPTAKVLQDLE
jgi:hypothetical protein